jgi:hypothetical protein
MNFCRYRTIVEGGSKSESVWFAFEWPRWHAINCSIATAWYANNFNLFCQPSVIVCCLVYAPSARRGGERVKHPPTMTRKLRKGEDKWGATLVGWHCSLRCWTSRFVILNVIGGGPDLKRGNASLGSSLERRKETEPRRAPNRPQSWSLAHRSTPHIMAKIRP